MNHAEAFEWVRYTYETLGCPELLDVTKLEFNNRMTRTIGTATYYKGGNAYSYNKTHARTLRDPGRAIIKLSTKLFDRASEEEQMDTVVHEACHIVDRYLENPRCEKTQGHGETWKELMRKCGLEPTRFHCVNTKGLRKKTRILADCKCMRHKITKHMWTRHNGNLRCKHCDTIVKYVKTIKIT